MIKVTLLDGSKIEVNPMCIDEVYRNIFKRCTDIKFNKTFDKIKKPEIISVKESCKVIKKRISDYFEILQLKIFNEI